MTRDDIIRMAHKAGGYTTEHYPDEWRLDVDDLDRFADLVAAAEREACAKICEQLQIPNVIYGAHPDYVDGKLMAVEQCADAIRARGQE
jgi:hypothetical protein